MNFLLSFVIIVATVLLNYQTTEAQTLAFPAHEKFSVNVPMNEGYCLIDSKRPSGNIIIQSYINRYAKNEYLFRVAVECPRIADREKSPPNIENSAIQLVIWRNQLEQFSESQRKD